MCSSYSRRNANSICGTYNDWILKSKWVNRAHRCQLLKGFQIQKGRMNKFDILKRLNHIPFRLQHRMRHQFRRSHTHGWLVVPMKKLPMKKLATKDVVYLTKIVVRLPRAYLQSWRNLFQYMCPFRRGIKFKMSRMRGRERVNDWGKHGLRVYKTVKHCHSSNVNNEGPRIRTMVAKAHSTSNSIWSITIVRYTESLLSSSAHKKLQRLVPLA